jgi:uncharacterized cupredoxin-like copper-binding protein
MHRTLITSAVMVVALASCAGATPTKPPSAVGAEEKEFSITMASPQAAAGSVTFNIKNSGTIVHEFVVVRTNLAANVLPVSGAVVSEEGLEVMGEAEDIAVGATVPLVLTLPAAHYVVFCNIEGHYAAGMRADLTVR